MSPAALDFLRRCVTSGTLVAIDATERKSARDLVLDGHLVEDSGVGRMTRYAPTGSGRLAAAEDARRPVRAPSKATSGGRQCVPLHHLDLWES